MSSPTHTPEPPGKTSPDRASGAVSKPGGWALISTGTILASMVLSGFVLGYWVDVWLDTKPALMLVFGGLGLVGGILKVHRLLL